MVRARVFPLLLSLSLAGATRAQVRIGLYCAMTGGSSQLGTSMRNGVLLAAEEINAKGGIDGQRVELVAKDDEANPEKGARIVRELIDRDRVAAILGPCNTAVADASVGYGNEKKVPILINVTTGARVNELFASSPENYVFRIAANDYVQTEVVVREAIDVRRHLRPALLCDDTGYGRNGMTKLIAALARRKLKAVYSGTFRIKDTDMTAQLREARAAGADVVLSFGIGPELGAVSNSLHALGWTVELLGGWTLGMQSYVQAAGRNGEGATMPATFIEASARTSRERSFIARYEERFAEKPIAVAPAAAQGYDSLYLLKLAIEQAHSTGGPAIKGALEDLAASYDGVTGKYRRPFSSRDHEAVHEDHVLLGRVKSGRVVPSWSY